MIEDPWFYAAAVPAVLIAGVSKGGFGGGLGILATPLLALASTPSQAAAVMLPILCLMDLLNIHAYRGRWDMANMKVIAPGAIIGIALAWATFSLFRPSDLKLLVGLIAVAFAANWLLRRTARDAPAQPIVIAKGWFWGAVAGFTSFAAHAGGPPVSVYLLPQKLDKTVYQATTALFFTVVNYVKLGPYFLLGLLSLQNLSTSVVLMPLAVVGIRLGVWLHVRVDPVVFFRFAYSFLTLTGLKLVWDGLAGLPG